LTNLKNNDIMKMLQIRNERRKPECQENSMHDLADTIFGVHASFLHGLIRAAFPTDGLYP